jgi:xylulokinase
VVGGLDQACAAFALGVDAAHGMLTLGTTAVVGIARDGRDGIPIEIPPVPMVDGRGWLAMAGSPAGGTALRWLRDRVLRAKGPGDRDEGRLVDEVAKHRTDALFLPHLGGSRVAFDDPGATAAFTGLTHASDRTDLVRAVLDGVAYEVAMLLRRLSGAGLQVATLRANGGGSRSRGWMQLIADATGLPVESVAGTDSAARGAARLALADTSGAVEDVAFRVDPRPGWRGYHDERLSRYVRTYEALRAIREQEDERA